MNRVRYRFEFDDLIDATSVIRVYRGSARGQLALIGSMAVEVHYTSLLRASLQQVPPFVADILDIATAVWVADRHAVRQADTACSINIVLSVRQPYVLNTPEVKELLKDTLYWYTEDRWSFDFQPRRSKARIAEVQLALPCIDNAPKFKEEVTLWSGGLDSLAGLYTRLKANTADRFVLLGTGSNNHMHKVQRDVAKVLDREFPNRLRLVQIPLHLSDSNGLPKNTLSRARSFTFFLFGAACAFLENQNILHVYENGVGAINLPFRASEVGIDHARSIHPISLLKMSSFLTYVFGTAFRIENPFLFLTKAQMCSIFRNTDTTQLIPQTVTCDRPHRAIPSQCGYCSSCLLRRQGLAASGIQDLTPYVITVRQAQRKHVEHDALHLLAMLEQVSVLREILRSTNPRQRLFDRWPLLRDTIEDMAEDQGRSVDTVLADVFTLYRTYIKEWEEVQPELTHGILAKRASVPAA